MRNYQRTFDDARACWCRKWRVSGNRERKMKYRIILYRICRLLALGLLGFASLTSCTSTRSPSDHSDPSITTDIHWNTDLSAESAASLGRAVEASIYPAATYDIHVTQASHTTILEPFPFQGNIVCGWLSFRISRESDKVRENFFGEEDRYYKLGWFLIMDQPGNEYASKLCKRVR